MSIFKTKCPSCRSINLNIPDSSMMYIYTIDNLKCEDCKVEFEINIVTRVYFWLFFNTIFLTLAFSEVWLNYFSKDELQMFVFLLLASLLLYVIIGFVVEFFRPWQYTVSKHSRLNKKIINYSLEGSLTLIGLLAVAELLIE